MKDKRIQAINIDVQIKQSVPANVSIWRPWPTLNRTYFPTLASLKRCQRAQLALLEREDSDE